jgi:hypothetical protein
MVIEHMFDVNGRFGPLERQLGAQLLGQGG